MEEKKEKGGGGSEIVSTDTECHRSFFSSSSASSSLLFETHPNTQTPRPLGVQVLSVITKKKKKKGSPLLFINGMNFHEAARGYIKNKIQSGRKMHGVNFNPWSHHKNNKSFLLLSWQKSKSQVQQLHWK